MMMSQNLKIILFILSLTGAAWLLRKESYPVLPNPRKNPKKNVARKKDTKLWEKVKKEAVKKMGSHSARAMQYAVKLYKDRGGKYLGKKTPRNDLAVWTRANWQYAPGSKKKDRYLPKEAWEKLSRTEKTATRSKKKDKMGKWVKNTKRAAEAAKKATAKARKK
jgi:hypothetical protein